MVYFVRHGKTDCNDKNIIQGRLDAPLNDEGIKEAKECAEKLKDVNFDVIYSSPLIRAKRTAEIINEFHNVPLICDERLYEQDAGEATGLSYDEVTKEMYDVFIKDPHAFKAESELDLFNRVQDFYNSLVKNNDKNILIVAHRGNYRQLYLCINNLLQDTKTEPIGNCEIKVF